MSNLLQQLNDDLTANVEKARCSLVEIHNGHGGAGAGIIVRDDGLVITNAHVVGRRGLRIKLPDGNILPARLIAYDQEHDLAALAVDAYDLPAIELGDSQNLQPGQWVMSIGHPWGVAGAVTAGIVIGSGADFPEMRTRGRKFITASLHMRPGHSGGPMIDSEGKLVGVNTLVNGPDVGVAIPIEVVKAFVKELGEVQPAHPLRYAESTLV